MSASILLPIYRATPSASDSNSAVAPASADNFVARLDDHKVYVYEIRNDEYYRNQKVKRDEDSKFIKEELYLTENSSGEQTPIQIMNVQNIEWVEGTNTLICAAYAGQHRKTDPIGVTSKISVIDVTTRSETRWKNISAHQYSEIRLISANNGQWVIALLDRVINRSSSLSILQIGNFKKRDNIEIEEHSIEHSVQSVSVCRQQGKIGVCVKKPVIPNQLSQGQYCFYFYEIEVDGKTRSLYSRFIGVIDNKKSSELLWSKNGQLFSLVNKDPQSSDQGILELGFLKQITKPFQSKWPGNSVSQTEMFVSKDNISYMTSADWDPSGKLILVSSQSQGSVEVWTGQGDNIYKDTFSSGAFRLKSINWRNRFQNLLTEEQEREIERNLKNYREK